MTLYGFSWWTNKTVVVERGLTLTTRNALVDCDNDDIVEFVSTPVPSIPFLRRPRKQQGEGDYPIVDRLYTNIDMSWSDRGTDFNVNDDRLLFRLSYCSTRGLIAITSLIILFSATDENEAKIASKFHHNRQYGDEVFGDEVLFSTVIVADVKEMKEARITCIFWMIDFIISDLRK